ncbi:hypothetical protein B0H13DRAFT_1893823 [Mycena leptocephala]|nr:hypothetical protein B0H13DRAFT_1893823 [Mycena leptocephala]
MAVAITTQVFMPPSTGPTTTSTPIFGSLAEQGILFTNYNAVTRPSEPNYVAAAGGDFFGMHDENMYHVPSNISCVVDILEDKHNSIFHALTIYSPSANTTFDAVSQDPARAARIRSLNDFANDVVNGTLPQWVFVTPNIVNDGHDTLIDYAASFLEYWLLPLLTGARFNGPEVLILLTFDENETHTEQNRLWALAFGDAIPLKLRGTTDDTTVQENWELKSLGRQDANACVSPLFAGKGIKLESNNFAVLRGYTNIFVPAAEAPQFNLTAIVPGALTSDAFVPFAAPNLTSPRGVLTRALGTPARLPPPVNMRALNRTTPWQMSPETTSGGDIVGSLAALNINSVPEQHLACRRLKLNQTAETTVEIVQ